LSWQAECDHQDVKLVFIFLLGAIGICAQSFQPYTAPEIAAPQGGWLWSIRRPYTPRDVPRVDFNNSPRLEALMRAGRIYLSLQDAIALALENNLDIEWARYGPRLAESDVLRASAGQLLRGLSGGLRQGPSSAGGGGVLAGANLLGGGSGGAAGGGEGGILSGITIQSVGTAIPNLDPVIFANGNLSHNTAPLTSRFVTGTNFLVSNSKGWNYGVQKGFLSGTTVTFGMSNSTLQQNSPNNDFNPTTRASASMEIRQRLLQGFGTGLNRRQIDISRNNRHISDLVFKAQVMETVSSTVQLYYDLVTLNETLGVKKQSLALSERLYSDNRRRVEIGTVAPIEIVQAEAEVATAQQEVTTAETQVLQQEMILKNFLTRTGVDSLALANARIVPVDKIRIPDKEEVEPVQDLIAMALARRPEIEQARIQLENSKLSIKGTRNALMPSLDLALDFQNNGLAGVVNQVLPVPQPGVPVSLIPRRDPRSVDQFFLGGYGTVLSQLLSRNFPDYSVSFQLNIPLRNRAAQADLIRDQLSLRRQQIDEQKTRNQIRLNVLNSHVALHQARAAYDTAVKARMLSEQTLNGERTKYQLGTSSFLNVVIVQRDLVRAQTAEVTALSSYIRAKVQLDNVTGQTLDRYSVSLNDAYAGVIKREPDLLPVLDQP
jgi:outer membrane protein TolC